MLIAFMMHGSSVQIPVSVFQTPTLFGRGQNKPMECNFSVRRVHRRRLSIKVRVLSFCPNALL